MCWFGEMGRHASINSNKWTALTVWAPSTQGRLRVLRLVQRVSGHYLTTITAPHAHQMQQSMQDRNRAKKITGDVIQQVVAGEQGGGGEGGESWLQRRGIRPKASCTVYLLACLLRHPLTQLAPSFLTSFLPSFLPSFVPSFLPSFLHSFLPSFLHIPFVRSFVDSFILSFFHSCLHRSEIIPTPSQLACFSPRCELFMWMVAGAFLVSMLSAARDARGWRCESVKRESEESLPSPAAAIAAAIAPAAPAAPAASAVLEGAPVELEEREGEGEQGRSFPRASREVSLTGPRPKNDIPTSNDNRSDSDRHRCGSEEEEEEEEDIPHQHPPTPTLALAALPVPLLLHQRREALSQWLLAALLVALLALGAAHFVLGFLCAGEKPCPSAC